jgi:ribosomal protein S18 acetylase RimI-like enzyme
MSDPTFRLQDVEIDRLNREDAPALANFYNGLSEASKRTFRPLGVVTTVAVCRDIACDNAPNVDKKFDLVVHDVDQIIGWGFLWHLWGDDALAETGDPRPMMLGLGITDAYQNHGLGSILMARLMAEARRRARRRALQGTSGASRVELTVVQDNGVAWRLYEKHGFVKVGVFVGEDGLPYFRMVAEF